MSQLPVSVLLLPSQHYHTARKIEWLGGGADEHATKWEDKQTKKERLMIAQSKRIKKRRG